MSYQHLLIAIDTGDLHEPILAEGARLAALYGARSTVMTVVKPLAQVYGGLDLSSFGQAGVAFEQQAVEQARGRLEALAKEAGLSQATVAVGSGPPAPEIVDYAAEHQVDLIVTGSHGRTGIGRLLGSVASGVLSQARCDVLTVKIEDAG